MTRAPFPLASAPHRARRPSLIVGAEEPRPWTHSDAMVAAGIADDLGVGSVATGAMVARAFEVATRACLHCRGWS